MKEILIVLLIIIFYLFISYFIRRLLLKVKIFAFILICIGYFLFTNYLFDLIIYMQQLLRSKGIYFEFGHASIVLLETFAICIVIGIANVIVVIFQRNKTKNIG
jgi:hypothetical protein